ncbi:MAG: hypothetical protein A2086_10100 [Spirochaetes bacterium GWD1_27_9]|nr:MAG: hypothetical protein A2Z98_05545 [Spirochaetes bacterium GWB1_27_13]OHD23732.1 MAG: hypothetical protein A2Y34_17665 [Spirochaetes bacterium GWC1_27_15]OHD42280.1 MAG: hypothetical protein A2086_10100 [Spirochaetes bacterium GWD1_27_9]
MDYLEELKKEFPEIRAFDEDDFYWEQEAYDYLKQNDTENAGKIFKKLCLSQPAHHGGFEGLAFVYYKTGEKDKALWFMEKAIAITQSPLIDYTIAISTIKEMETNLINIKENKNLIEWWNTTDE